MASNVSIQNRPSGTSTTLTTKTLSVTVVGNKDDVEDLKATDLKVTIDMKNASKEDGLNVYPARITIPGKKTIWVYYGSDAQDNLSVYITTKSS